MRAFREPDIIEIPIRPDHSVRVHGIPWDLTKEEVDKIVAVIGALSNVPAGRAILDQERGDG